MLKFYCEPIIAWFHVSGMKLWFIISNHEVFVTILLNFSNENSLHNVFVVSTCKQTGYNKLHANNWFHIFAQIVCNFRPCLFSLSATKRMLHIRIQIYVMEYSQMKWKIMLTYASLERECSYMYGNYTDTRVDIIVIKYNERMFFDAYYVVKSIKSTFCTWAGWVECRSFSLTLSPSFSASMYNVYVSWRVLICCEIQLHRTANTSKQPRKKGIWYLCQFLGQKLLRRRGSKKNHNMKIVMESLSSSWSSSVTVIKCIYYVSVRCTHTMIQHFTKMEVAPSFQHITIV